jgi:hypothetical protein
VVTIIHHADWPAMELTYRLTRDDHQQCCKLAQHRVLSPLAGLAMRMLPMVWLGLVLLLLAVLGVLDQRTAAVASLGYVGGVGGVRLCGRFWQHHYWVRWLPDGSSSLSELRLTMDGEGIVCSDAAKSTRYSWHAFSDVTERAGFILLWFDRGGECLAIPARVLANDDARRDFVTLVRDRIALAAAT